MNDKEKLKHLVIHWREHNAEHAGTYRNWAEKMRVAGEKEAESILNDIADDIERIDSSFRELIIGLQ